MTSEYDIFADINNILARGPSADDMQQVASLHQPEEPQMRVADVAAPAPIDAHDSISFASDQEMSQYESDIGVNAANFARIIPTTFGLSGVLSNVSFSESALIPFIAQHLHYPCVRATCNYGDVTNEHFERLVADGSIDLTSTKKSARARAKKQKRTCAKPRKIQGNGTCFNSSVLFWIYSEAHRTVYKIRLFRTGQFGLPGTRPEMIRDILHICRDVFIPTLFAILRARDAAQSIAHVTEPIALVSLISIMKNYKWYRTIPKGTILDLAVIAERIRADSRVAGKLPYAISYVQYGICDTKLSIKFKTPSTTCAGKTVRVNVFLSGKINILGAHDSATSKNICDYLVAILTDDIVVTLEDGDENETDESDSDMVYSDDE